MYVNHTGVLLHTLLYFMSNNESNTNDVAALDSNKVVLPQMHYKKPGKGLVEQTVSPMPATPCYDHFGCFPVDAPWTSESRPFPVVPEPPKKVNPIYCLRTRMNAEHCEILDVYDAASVYNTHYLNDKRTFFIIHGYLESQRRVWIQRMAAELLKMDNVNVVIVDWGGGSSPPYAQAVANIRLVGAMTAQLIANLINEVGISAKDVHVIGHSLGAQTASYVGADLQTKHGHKLGRITGLDAAEPWFSASDPIVRLDVSDADFVDAIHTDAAPFMAGGLGIREPVGHVDFYPNGGRDQPGCAEGMSNFITEKGSVLRGIEKFLNCNHVRSNDFFAESINSNASFWGVQCHSWEAYTSGTCFSCTGHGSRRISTKNGLGPRCARMGMHALDTVDKMHIKHGRPMKVFLMTGAEAPFARNQYRVTLRISNSSRSLSHGGEVGVVSVQLRGTAGSTQHLQLNTRERYFEPGSTHTHIVIGAHVGNMTSAVLSWDYRTSMLNPLTWRFLMMPRIYVANVTVDSLETADSMTITPSEGTPLISRKPLECQRSTPEAVGDCQIKLINTFLS